jgi:hypothetical protein
VPPPPRIGPQRLPWRCVSARPDQAPQQFALVAGGPREQAIKGNEPGLAREGEAPTRSRPWAWTGTSTEKEPPRMREKSHLQRVIEKHLATACA